MGLRINHNIPALMALRNLRVNDRNQARSLEKLSTGLRIVRASDDPSGLVISEQLRAQIASLNQAADNTQSSMNLITTADAALQELSDLLVEIRDSIVFALNEGVSSPEQVQAEQASVDEAIAAISRIANTTRYADSSLLNGLNGYMLNSSVASQINDLVLRQVTFPQGVTSITFDILQVTSAARGLVTFGNASALGETTTIRITGPLGTAEVSFFSVATSATITAQVNAVAGQTGVYASQYSGTGVSYFQTEEFGEAQVISVEVLDGTILMGSPVGALAARNAGFAATNQGQDAQVRFAGQVFTGRGRFFDILTNQISMTFNLNVRTTDTIDVWDSATSSFRVRRSGMMMQLRDEAELTDILFAGIPGVGAANLGYEEIQDIIARAVSGDTSIDQGGYLSSMRSGNANDLETNPQNGMNIVDRAIDQVTDIRSFLGSLATFNLEPNLDSVEVAIENLQASESAIRDLDFAEETANFTRTQILFQAGSAVLASANLIPQTVLTLLQ